ncbi:hypothetical protein [Insolitispirillum peregrinum]|uniref:Uncharacterized protein n=1 Tax=Insolitispirillum peregrinum TaxID=80876 RepID=A0A1N7LKJ5_9PROT|nr:hypothetical protein [Insolitispirillum peregrinum]SIS74365.1 hypothetical protein SAMN05421779_103387 [Insolitispirillum peregrinum]
MNRSSFAAFVAALLRDHGPEAAEVRHELFFQSHKPFPTLRGWGAVLRDARLLAKGKAGAVIRQEKPLAVLVATLAGASGWQTLARALPALRQAGLQPVILAHPRLPDALFPADIPLMRPLGGRLRAGVSDGKCGVRAARLRLSMWQAAIDRTLHGLHGVLIMHNDFDMMSTACLSRGWPTVCLQHGIPTDEFFPCRADYQVVWSELCRRAFLKAGVPPERVIVDALGRGEEGGLAPSGPPQDIAVVSQQQAVIFGNQLPFALTGFVSELVATGLPVQVLLHPAERGRSSYGSAPVSVPPHARLVRGSAPAMVLAYCSTMALEAAALGHWVVTLDWSFDGNQLARRVAQPPLKVHTPLEVVRLFHRLGQDDAFRAEWAEQQRTWLTDSFSASPGGLGRLLAMIVSPCP